MKTGQADPTYAWVGRVIVKLTSPPNQRKLPRLPIGTTMSNEPIYKVIFYNQGQIFEIYTHQIYQSDLYGFIEVEELVFGERSGVLVDPGEEKLKSEFEGVNRSYIPMHAIVRIDEVAKEGVGSITEAKAGNNVSIFPTPAFTPKGSSD